jgi:hypothetical protein
MQDALLTTLSSGRSVINSVTLNSNLVQSYNFSPFIGTFRFYIKDGTRNNQLWLVNEAVRAGVPCASGTFDNTYIARSNWAHDALFKGKTSYFSFKNGVVPFSDLATLAAAIQENPQNAPGNWLRSSPALVPGTTVFADTFVNPQSSYPGLAAPSSSYTRPVIFNRNNQKYGSLPVRALLALSFLTSLPLPSSAATSTSAALSPTPMKESHLQYHLLSLAVQLETGSAFSTSALVQTLATFSSLERALPTIWCFWATGVALLRLTSRRVTSYAPVNSSLQSALICTELPSFTSMGDL